MGKLKKAVNRTIDALKREGFTLQYYESMTTKSYYLKVDYGVCHTIRFSDHFGKKHLSYKYNVNHQVDKKRWSKDKYWQFFCPLNEADEIVKEIVKTREYKMNDLGEEGYRALMREYYIKGLVKKGFWQQSKVINKGRNYYYE